MIPEIETERLLLRAHEKKDFERSAALWADPVVVKHTIGSPSTEAQSWGRMMSYLGHWSLMGYGYWAVQEKSSGLFVGDLGFADFKRGVHESIAGVPELGWVLSPSVHGKGYATEAAKAALAWGDRNLPGDRTVCLISPENAPSLRVAEKIGYAELLRATFKELPTVVFSRSRAGL